MKWERGSVIKLFVGDGIMGHSKLVKATVDHIYGLLWIFPELWIKQSPTMQQLLHGLAWAKIPICYI